MRRHADIERIRRFMRALADETHVDARVYFTGGATAVLLGWRESTIDVDVRFVPEHDALFRALAGLKERLELNVELASPADFIPVRPDWEARSPFIAREGGLAFHHFDLYAQALAKVERGHARDIQDVQEMLARGLVDRRQLLEYFAAIEGELYRYPAIDAPSFRRAVEAMFGAPR
ncbi:MAG TPA: DUF6036 family nucleotidyltransferase [Vicinamibacterales bacterium]|nr:DUF6036 family nucleotidyltransferase [Vicinamibacterales bacterium]